MIFTLKTALSVSGTAALLARCKQEKTTYGAALSAAFLKGVADVKELKDKKLDKFSFTRYILPLFLFFICLLWVIGIFLKLWIGTLLCKGFLAKS